MEYIYGKLLLNNNPSSVSPSSLAHFIVQGIMLAYTVFIFCLSMFACWASADPLTKRSRPSFDMAVQVGAGYAPPVQQKEQKEFEMKPIKGKKPATAKDQEEGDTFAPKCQRCISPMPSTLRSRVAKSKADAKGKTTGAKGK